MECRAHLTQPIGTILCRRGRTRLPTRIKCYGLETMRCAQDDRDSATPVRRRKTEKANRANRLNRQGGEPKDQRDIFETAPEERGAAGCQDPPDG